MAINLTGGLPDEREYFFAECPAEPEIRDATNVWIEEENGAFGMRIGVEAASPEWNAHEIYLDIAFPDGRVISRRTREAPHPAIGAGGLPTVRAAGPLRFECVEPFRRWTVAFSGEAAEITTAELIETPYPEEKVFRDVEFTIEMTMAVPPWIAGSLVADKQAGYADQNDFISPRYEQLCRVTGDLRIGDEHYSFKGQGLRIKRQGYRKFEGFFGHCWQSCLFPSGKAFGMNLFPPREGQPPSYAEAFVFTGDGPLIPATPEIVPWLKRLELAGDDVSLQLGTPDGPAAIAGTSYVNKRARFSVKLPVDFPPDFPIIQQSHIRYIWGDEAATGMMERSNPANQMER